MTPIFRFLSADVSSVIVRQPERLRGSFTIVRWLKIEERCAIANASPQTVPISCVRWNLSKQHCFGPFSSLPLRLETANQKHTFEGGAHLRRGSRAYEHIQRRMRTHIGHDTARSSLLTVPPKKNTRQSHLYLELYEEKNRRSSLKLLTSRCGRRKC